LYFCCILALTFSTCEALPSNAIGGAVQILAVIEIVLVFVVKKELWDYFGIMPLKRGLTLTIDRRLDV